jgi:hypothetical protein
MDDIHSLLEAGTDTPASNYPWSLFANSGPLQKQYCPPIDSSLFSAIVSDYDLSNTVSTGELRSTLEILKESAIAEENAAFDPSGSSGLQDEQSSRGSSDRARSWHGDFASSTTEDTEITGIGQALDSIDLCGHDRKRNHPDSGREQHETSLEGLPVEEKLQLLKEMFPGGRDFDISYTFKKSGNNFGASVEELLNQAFLDEEGHRKKGIEAFTEPAVTGRGRRKRKKQKQLLRRTSSTPGPTDDQSSYSPSPLSRWDRGKEDVDFIAQRTFFSPKIIASTYHKNGASLPATIAALCASETLVNPYLSDTAPSLLKVHAAELSVDFQRLPYPQLKALINLTHPSTASAHELARALSSQASSSASIAIIPQYLPRPASPIGSTPITPPSNNSTPLPSSTAAALATSRSNAFAQASSAYRLSKSKPLMGGAASYYSSVGRDASASLRRHQAAEADALVTSQSTLGDVDLHGVNVNEAVSIARDRVGSWWEKEGRERARQGKVMGGGLRVITGVGRHSEGRRGKLGPAVGRMLHSEGWKVEVGEGVIEVVGRQRR